MKTNQLLLKIIWAATACIITLVLGLPAVLLSASTVTTVTISPAPQSVAVGSQFSVNIILQPASTVAGFQIDLAFNPSLVRVDSVAEGALLKQGGAQTYFLPGQVNNSNGCVKGVMEVITTPGMAVSSAGIVASFYMTAIAAGNCAFTLSNVITGDMSGQPQTTSLTNAQISIHLAAPNLTSPQSGIIVSGASINFQWRASSGASGYQLTVIKTSDGSAFINKSVGNVLSFTQSGFPNNGSQYQWSVAAGNGAGWTPSIWSTFYNGQTAPPAPALIAPATAVTISGLSVNFTWNASKGASSYWITIVKASDNSVVVNKSVGNVLSFWQGGFPNNGTQFKWSVAAINNVGKTVSLWQYFTNGPLVPAVPVLLTPGAGAIANGSAVNFQWAAANGAATYRLTVIKVSNNSLVIDKTIGNVLSFKQSSFTNDGSQFKWMVAAGNSAGWSSSAWRTFINKTAK